MLSVRGNTRLSIIKTLKDGRSVWEKWCSKVQRGCSGDMCNVKISHAARTAAVFISISKYLEKENEQAHNTFESANKQHMERQK